MKAHESLHPAYPGAAHTVRGFKQLMQVHEDRYVKRAGVAGARARATGYMFISFRKIKKK